MLVVPSATGVLPQLPQRGYLIDAYAHKARTDAWLAEQRRQIIDSLVDAHFATQGTGWGNR